MRGLGPWGGRIWSLGGALRGFLRLGIGMHFMRGLGDRGSRLRSLGGAHRRFLAVGVGSDRMHRNG